MNVHDMTPQMIFSLEFLVTVFTFKDMRSSKAFLIICVHLNFEMFLLFVASHFASKENVLQQSQTSFGEGGTSVL